VFTDEIWDLVAGAVESNFDRLLEGETLSNQIAFSQVVDSYWHSPESGGILYKARRLKTRFYTKTLIIYKLGSTKFTTRNDLCE